MKKYIIVCNTCFQLISAIQMKLTIFSNSYTNVVLTDYTSSLISAKEKLKETGLFEEVHLIYCKKDDKVSKLNVFHVLKIIKKIIGTKNKSDFYEKSYDQIIYFNLNVPVMSLFSELYSNNKAIVASRYEEGILSYGATWNDDWKSLDSRSIKIGCKIRSLLGKENITNHLENYYCFFPELYEGALNPISIPRISANNDNLKRILANVFDVNGVSDQYSRKYIYFSSVGDFEGGTPVGEFQLVTKIAKIVGKDNLLIKTHPRDETGSYEKAGFQVAKRSDAPWEAIQLNGDYSSCVFLTNVSGSVLSVNFCMENGPKTVFLFPFCDNMHNDATRGSEKMLIRLFEKFRNHPQLSRFSVEDDLSKLTQYL